MCFYVIGAGTIGCCAHIASVLYYLGMARHFPLKLPAEDIFDSFINCGGVDYGAFESSDSDEDSGSDSDGSL